MTDPTLDAAVVYAQSVVAGLPQNLDPPESSHDKGLRWFHELVPNVGLTTDQVIEVAKVYVLLDIKKLLDERLPREP